MVTPPKTFHQLSPEATLEELAASANGLTPAEADARLYTYGANRLPEPARCSALQRYLQQYDNVLIYVLLGCVAMMTLLQHWIDAAVIMVVVLANTIIGYLQEGKAEKAIEAIRHMLAPQAHVIRGGERLSVSGDALVPGDIVVLEAGDKVPADIRLLTAHSLSMQEAILTGESAPSEKHTKAVPENAPIGDRACMAFSGTLVAAGHARGVVVATGANTEIGRISGLLSDVATLTTPLVQQMAVFAKRLSLFILALAALLLVYGTFIMQYSFTELFLAVVGLSVAAIPEGLPAVLTITLAIGVQAMAKRNAIVRRLPAIETLGSVSVICTDKTGTLTRNEMMVATVLTPHHEFSLQGAGYEPKGTVHLDDAHVAPAEHAVLSELGRAALLCNDAALRLHDGVWTVEGDPMEGALLAFAAKVDIDTRAEHAAWTRTDAIPFDARQRFMATLNHDHTQQACIFVKGAPESILAMCRDQRRRDGQTEPLNTAYWTAKAESIAARGQRVLALAVASVKADHTVLAFSDVEGTLTLLGMVGLIDPPRPEAITAIAECHGAGIRVKMITGDHAKTAAAIGRQIGLKNPDRVLTGVQLDAMDDNALRQAVLDCDIFARTSPEHKLRLVMALQAQGMIVAMTGDGVNDAPALKRADAGIAMGKKGSEAAKEAAQLVLADDNFASIAAAVHEGRTVYNNLVKVIAFLLPVNGGEAFSIILSLLLGLTLPISPLQILWVNMISSVVLAMTLAFEPSEARVMQHPPRPAGTPLLTGFVVWRVLFVSVLFAAGIFGQFQLAKALGMDVETARTIAVNTLVAMEVSYLFSIRYSYGTSLTWRGMLGTKPVLIALSIVILAQLCFIYAPFMHHLLDSAPLDWLQLMLIVATGVAVFLIIEIEKQFRLAFLPKTC